MRRLRRFGFNRIKEGFDQLPTAICFFDSRGSIVLCNRQMYRLSHYLFESDMQYLGEVERALATPPEGILQLSNMEGTYRFPDNTIWQFEKTEVTDRYGETYIQLTAADVTELCHVLGQLFVENKKLSEDEEHLQRLSENVEKIAREKELLTAKSAMHDNLAASIIVMKQYLSGDFGGIGNSSAGMGEEYCFSGGRTFIRKRETVCQCKKQWCPCADRRKGTTGKSSRDDVCCYAGMSE